MAITQITTGGAHSSENGSINGVAGDQKQSGNPDYSGEVSMRTKNEASFKSSFGSYVLYRPTSPNDASAIAQLMITACNNPHIGYSQSSRGGIFEHGASSTVNINCDCSSLVSYCVSTGANCSVNSNTSGLGGALERSGKFMSPVAVSSLSFASNPPCNGDVLVKSGSHAEIVVAGSPRTGKTDEITSGTFVGEGTAIQGYRDAYGIVYDFTPRTTAPTTQDEYFKQSNGKTKNSSYAWNRFSEIMQSKCTLPKGDCKKWYLYKEDGYAGGTEPALGAVMCFTNQKNPIDPGLVYIVEGVALTYITVSFVDNEKGEFHTEKRFQRNGSWDMDRDGDREYEYVFQGFIYNPAVAPNLEATPTRSKFVATAKEQIGTDSKFTKEHSDIKGKTAAWSGAFVRAVADSVGSLVNVIIPDTTSCSDIGKLGKTRNMGAWLDGPALKGQPHPQLGDIALFRNTPRAETADTYIADKAGIVISVVNKTAKTGNNEDRASTFTVVMGDVDGKVASKVYTTTSGAFSGLYRPYWSKVDGMLTGGEDALYWGQSAGTLGNLYRMYSGMYIENTAKEDAAIRDLKYIKLTEAGIEPSIKPTGMLLCAINYTGMLANMYGALAQVMPMSGGMDPTTGLSAGMNAGMGLNGELPPTNVDLSNIKVDPNLAPNVDYTQRAIFALINSQLNNQAGTIGIMANIQGESSFNLSAVSGDGGYGLCQWTNTSDRAIRATKMREYCSQNGGEWSSNMAGQIGFLFYEASHDLYDSGYTRKKLGGAISFCKSVPISLDGAISAMRTFLYDWENPDQVDVQYGVRKKYAENLWNAFFGGARG